MMARYRRRDLEPQLRSSAQQYPIITVTGPRQSGKTTLCQAVFDSHAYVTLETADVRAYANEDPRGFLAQFDDGVILDEFQRAPELAGYLQGLVDADPHPGRFVLTGSQYLAVSSAVSQSLAGRTAILTLLPLSWPELQRFDHAEPGLHEALLRGGYPRVAQWNLEPARWYADYIQTYVERDVRNIANIGDLEAFQRFVRLSAGRTAQEQNYSALGADAGVSHNTARAWLSVLEAGYLVHRVPAWHRNVRKQITKSPKLHFMDSGLLCRLLGIRTVEQLRSHPLIGAIFESWVVAEIAKHWANQGLPPQLSHYRESRGVEIDLIDETSGSMQLIEVKSAATVIPRFLEPLRRLATELGLPPDSTRLVYGGDQAMRRNDVLCRPWRQAAVAA